MGGLRSICAGFIFMLASPGYTQDSGVTVQFGGFGTLGVAATDSHQVAYPRETSQPTGAIDQLDAREDSRLGLQGNVWFSASLFAILQVVSKYRYDGSFRPDISWAAVSWNPASNIQLRAGRMGFELFDKTMSKDVGYSFLWLRPPMEVFASNLVQAVDGLDAAQTFALGTRADWTLKLLAGRTVGKVPVWGIDNPMDNSGGPILGMTASLQTGPWRIRSSLARVGIPENFPYPLSQLPVALDSMATLLRDPGLAQTGTLLNVKGSQAHVFSVGINYDEDPVQAAGYFIHTTSNAFLLPGSKAGYLSLGYRLGAVVPYVMYARVLSERLETPYLGVLPLSSDPKVKQLTEATNSLVQSRNADQHTWSVGLRWDCSSRADFKLQLDQVRNPNGTPYMYVQEPGFKGRLTVMSAVVDFVFGGGRP